MTYFVFAIELFTETGGRHGSLFRLEASTGEDAALRVCALYGLPAHRVYLISEQEAEDWPPV